MCLSGTTSYGSVASSLFSIHRFLGDAQKHGFALYDPFDSLSASYFLIFPPVLPLVKRRVSAARKQDSRGFPRFLRWSMTRGCAAASRHRLVVCVWTRACTHGRSRATHTCTSLWHTRLPWAYMYRRYGHACNRESWAGGAHCRPTRVSIHRADCTPHCISHSGEKILLSLTFRATLLFLPSLSVDLFAFSSSLWRSFDEVAFLRGELKLLPISKASFEVVKIDPRLMRIVGGITAKLQCEIGS